MALFECCHHCDRRHMRCHSICTDYLRDKILYDQRKEHIQKCKEKENLYGKVSRWRDASKNSRKKR